MMMLCYGDGDEKQLKRFYVQSFETHTVIYMNLNADIISCINLSDSALQYSQLLIIKC